MSPAAAGRLIWSDPRSGRALDRFPALEWAWIGGAVPRHGGGARIGEGNRGMFPEGGRSGEVGPPRGRHDMAERRPAG